MLENYEHKIRVLLLYNISMAMLRVSHKMGFPFECKKTKTNKCLASSYKTPNTHREFNC